VWLQCLSKIFFFLKKTLVALLISDEARKIIRNKEKHYIYNITYKKLIFQEDIKILKLYIHNNQVSKYIRQNCIAIQGEIVKSTITFGNFFPSLLVLDRTSRQKVRT
jgi:hypothetical protein